MSKKLLCLFGIFFLLITVFSGCSLDPEETYLVRTGGQAAGSGHFETGVYISPNGALVPHLIEDARETGTLSEVENLLRQLGFNQSWIQSVKNNLNRNGSAFVFCVNISSYYRWLWITKN